MASPQPQGEGDSVLPAERRAFDPPPVASAARQDPAWRRLKDATNALRRPAGAEGRGRPVATRPRRGPRPRRRDDREHRGPRATLPAQGDYLEQARVDLREWVEGGCAKPDFTASLALFRPERQRHDGIEHLVVFPMYTPNGSPDTRYEALIVRTPWPDFIDRLERESYNNDKFVPVQLVDNTEGYDSECAVLFPETVSVVGRPTNHFGGIFCDRESARLRRSLAKGRGVSSASTSRRRRRSSSLLPSWPWRPTSCGTLSTQLAQPRRPAVRPVHDRQRLPYWMFSLEELRVDLSAFVDSSRLAREGLDAARYVAHAILFDRILRFPITGSRVRNYDGLGGQLLFGYLHKRDVLRWTDNRLLIDWDRLEEAVTALRDEVETMYREGIDLSKVSYWISGHDLVARYVKPNVMSQWQRETRVLSDEGEPRAWVDRVLDDEFPLSMFYEQFKKKLADAAAVTQTA